MQVLRRNSSVFREPRKTTDKCRRDRHRKVTRFSARGFAYRILIRFGGIERGATTEEKSLFGLRRKSNHFRRDLVGGPTRPIRASIKPGIGQG